MLALLLGDDVEGALRQKQGKRGHKDLLLPARAAAAFKAAAAKTAANTAFSTQAPSLTPSGVGLAISSSLYNSTGPSSSGTNESGSQQQLSDGSCFVQLPGAVGHPAASSSTAVAAPGPVADPVIKKDKGIRQLQAGPGPCAEGMEKGYSWEGLLQQQHSDASISSRARSQDSSPSEAMAAAADRSAALSSSRWLRPSVGLELLQNMGLAGSGRQPLALVASHMTHAALVAPRALHASARGRWLKRCIFELLFIVWYQVCGFPTVLYSTIYTCSCFQPPLLYLRKPFHYLHVIPASSVRCRDSSATVLTYHSFLIDHVDSNLTDN